MNYNSIINDVINIFNFDSKLLDITYAQGSRKAMHNKITCQLMHLFDNPPTPTYKQSNCNTENVYNTMPLYCNKVVTNVNAIQINIQNPITWIMENIPDNTLNVPSIFFRKLQYYRKQIKILIKESIEKQTIDEKLNQAQFNIKLYLNMFYSIIDQPYSIIQPINVHSFSAYVSNEMNKLYTRVLDKIAFNDVLYYDTDTIYIVKNKTNDEIMADKKFALQLFDINIVLNDVIIDIHGKKQININYI